MKQKKLKIVYRPIDEVIPYANNARTHSQEQIDQIKASIVEFGMNTTISIRNNVIVYGHGRVEALKQLGETEVPTVDLSHLTEAQTKAYILADNRMALNAGWDTELLKIELSALDDLDFDLSLTGFDDDEIFEFLKEDIDPQSDEDAVPEIPDEPISRLGDIWILGNHKVMCGDSTSIDAVEKLMDGNKADMVFTDPPYGVNYQSNMRTKSKKFKVLANDDVFLDVAPIIEMFSDGWVFVWTSWKVLTKWIEMFTGFGYPTNQVIWFKGGGGMGDLKKTFLSDYETALVWNRGAELTGKRIGSVWKVGKDGATEYAHPTQKPVALSEEALDKTTKQGYLILDLFGGSGSTLIACEKTNRINCSMELDPKYVDVIVKRWQDYTGKEAYLESTGESYEALSHGN